LVVVNIFASLIPQYFAAPAAQGSACTPDSGSFFFLPHWWEYLPTKIDNIGNCSPVFVPPGDIWAVALALVDMLLRIGGFVAVISIIVAGVQYITSGGTPDNATKARKRLTNSLIGLAIVFIASLVVSYIGNQIG
jgi:hypothetical protein